MSVTLTGTGGLMVRLGQFSIATRSINAARGYGDLSGASLVSAGTGVNNILLQYESTLQNTINGLYGFLTNYQSTAGGFLSSLQSYAQNTVTQMFVNDGSIQNANINLALKTLNTQMVTAVASIKGNTVSASISAGSNTGTGAALVSVLGPNGLTLQYCKAEPLAIVAKSDSQTTGVTPGSETWSITGAVQEADPLMYDWPLGSAVTTQTQTNDSASSQALLTNGNFELWTSNTPNQFVIDTGTAGVTVFQDSGAYRGSSALRILGTGAETTIVSQTFNNPTTGTTYKLLPSTVYAVNFFVKVSAVPGAGVLKIELADNSGTVINDAAAVPNAVTVTLSAATTSYVAHGGFFRTPAVLNATSYKIRAHLSTALDSGKSVFIDDLTLAVPTQVYPNGPFVAIFVGAVATVIGDSYTATIANDWGSKAQSAFEKWFGMRANSLVLPFVLDGSQTIADTLF